MNREEWEATRFDPDTVPGRRDWTRYLDGLIAAEAHRTQACPECWGGGVTRTGTCPACIGTGHVLPEPQEADQ